MLPQRTKAKPPISERESASVGQVHIPSLELSCNGRLVQKLSLDRPQFLIGRAKDNDITISSDYVSRYHVMLLRHEGATILVDLQSTNGTFVNSELVFNYVLANDDVIAVDQHSIYEQFSIKYVDPDAAAGIEVSDIAGAEKVIEDGLKEVGKLLGIKASDLSPTLRVNSPLKVGYIDDR